MPQPYEADPFEPLSREELIRLLKIYSRLLQTMDGLWFLEAEQAAGPNEAVRFDESVWRQYGQVEARRLKRFLGIESVSTLAEMCNVMRLSLILAKQLVTGHNKSSVWDREGRGVF